MKQSACEIAVIITIVSYHVFLRSILPTLNLILFNFRVNLVNFLRNIYSKSRLTTEFDFIVCIITNIVIIHALCVIMYVFR